MKMRITFMLTALITLGFYGCSDDLPLTSNDLINVPTSSADWASIQNPANPFNEIGVLHNDCLANIESVIHPNGPEDLNASMGQIINFFQDSTWYENYVTQTWLLERVDSAGYYYDMHYAAAGQSEKNFFDAITTAIYDSSNALNASGIDTTFIPRLATIESDILASGLEDSEKCLPLLYVAIAKHSAAYWSQVITTDGINGYSNKINLSKVAWPAWIKAACREIHAFVHEDAKVGLAAAVTAGLVSLATPVTATAAGVGIAAAAVGGSIYKALDAVGR